MIEMNVEGFNLLDEGIHEEDNISSPNLKNSNITTNMRSNSSNADNEQFVTQSPFRSSDPTIINRQNVMKFEKTGDLLKKMKRQLSTQALQKSSNQGSSRPNDKLSTNYSISQLNLHDFASRWQKIQKDEMTEAIMDEYEKQILRLTAELEDIKEEKKQIKETLQKQRRFYMTEMYNKELVIEEMDFQAEKLKGQIEKYVNLQYQFQEKIRLLEIQNAQYAYQLEGWMNSSKEDSQGMSLIHEESEDWGCNSTGNSHNDKRTSNKMFMSSDHGLASYQNSMLDNDPLQMIRMAHEREIQKYEKEIRNIKNFYENKLKALRRSMTPKKGQPRNSIHILDEYICSDTISCQSQSRPQNLRNILKQQFNQGRSAKKVDDTTSFATAKYFMYPVNSKKNLNGQDLFMREQECEQLELKCVDVGNGHEEDDFKPNNLNKFFGKYLPSIEFLKGFGIGTFASGILTLMIYKKLAKN